MTQIPVAICEFVDGGTTIWVHNDQGATVLRIKAKKVIVKQGCENICAHADMIVDGNIEVCVPGRKVRCPKSVIGLTTGKRTSD